MSSTSRPRHDFPAGPAHPRRADLARLAALVLLLVLGACGKNEQRPAPTMPDVPLEGGEWFWRAVLAAPIEGETAPRQDILDLEPPAAVIDGLAALLAEDDPAALTTLMKALRHPEVGVAVAAAGLLGESGRLGAIPRLVKGVGPYPVDYDVPIAVRVAQASALARLGNPTGVPLLLAILAEDTGAQLPRLQIQWDETQQLVFLRELALPGLIALAKTDFDYVPNGSVPAREAAVLRARAFWDERRIDLWRAAPSPASDPEFETRARLLVANLRTFQLRQIDGARFALAHFGPGVLPELEEGLASPDDYLRVHVLEVMATLCDDVDAKTRGRIAIIASHPLLDDASPTVAAQAARTCGAARVADPLIEAIDRRGESEVRLAIVDALGATGRPEAAEVLRSWLARQATDGLPPDLRVAARVALFRTDPGESPAGWLALLAETDLDLAYPAVERLITITGSDHGLDVLAAPAERAQALAAAREALDALVR